MIRFVQIALYLAIMTALGWALWQVLPPIINPAFDAIGPYWAMAVMVAVPIVCWSLAYYLNRRDSGAA